MGQITYTLADVSVPRVLLELDRHLADVPDRLRHTCELCEASLIVARVAGDVVRRLGEASDRLHGLGFAVRECLCGGCDSARASVSV